MSLFLSLYSQLLLASKPSPISSFHSPLQRNKLHPNPVVSSGATPWRLLLFLLWFCWLWLVTQVRQPSLFQLLQKLKYNNTSLFLSSHGWLILFFCWEKDWFFFFTLFSPITNSVLVQNKNSSFLAIHSLNKILWKESPFLALLKTYLYHPS